MKEHDDGGPKLVESRPEAVEAQVLDVSEIKKGQQYTVVHQDTTSQTFRAESEPYQDTDGNWWVDAAVDVRLQPGEKSEIKATHQKISLADSGVVPYHPSGLWNPVNHLLRPN